MNELNSASSPGRAIPPPDRRPASQPVSESTCHILCQADNTIATGRPERSESL